MKLLIATAPDGSQTLVTLWEELGAPLGEVATRHDPRDTWGVPTPLVVAP